MGNDRVGGMGKVYNGLVDCVKVSYELWLMSRIGRK